MSDRAAFLYLFTYFVLLLVSTLSLYLSKLRVLLLLFIRVKYLAPITDLGLGLFPSIILQEKTKAKFLLSLPFLHIFYNN